MTDVSRAITTPHLDLVSRLLHEYADLQRTSDRMLLTALELSTINRTDLRQLVSIQREMLAGLLTVAVGQVDMLRVIQRDPDLALALAVARHEEVLQRPGDLPLTTPTLTPAEA